MRKRTCRRLVWVWFAFALLTALGLPGASYACTCAVAPSESYPADGATVPSNAKFWLSWPRAFRNLSPERQHRVPSSVRWHGGLGPSVTADDVVLAHRLVGPAGETIPLGVSTLLIGRGQRPAYFVLSPTRPLAPGVHTLQVLYPSPGSQNVSVTVERRALTAPPDVPRVEFLPLSTPVGAGSCSHGFYFSFHAPHRGIVTVLGLTREVRALPERPGWVSDVFDSAVGTVGSATCRSNWDFRDGPIVTRVGAFDIAGNFSGWSDAVHLEVTEEEFEAWDRSAVASIARNFGVPRESPRGCACSLRDKDASRALPSAVLGLLLLCGRRLSLWGVRRGLVQRASWWHRTPSGAKGASMTHDHAARHNHAPRFAADGAAQRWALPLDSRWLYLGDPVSATEAAVTVYRAFPGAWFLHHDGESIGPFEDRTILRALRVACTPTIDGCELGPHKLAVTELAPRRTATPGPRWVAVTERDLPPSVTAYDHAALEPVEGCCSTFDQMPTIIPDDSLAWEDFMSSRPAVTGRLGAAWNAHPAGSLVFAHEEGLGLVVVDLP